MMLFNGFESCAELAARVKAAKADPTAVRPVRFTDHAVETSFFGPEFKPGKVETYAVCLDHPKRTKFAQITVDAEGWITSVK